MAALVPSQQSPKAWIHYGDRILFAVRKTTYLFCFVLAGILVAGCNNYNLKEKLENPGGSGQAEKFSDRLFAFVTTATTMGDMQGLVDDNCTGTGYTRADCFCQQLAQKNGLRMSSSSKFVAWLGETNNSMKCRIQNLTGPSCTLPAGNFTWYNTKFQPVFTGTMGANSTGTELFNVSATLGAVLNFTESGVQLPAGQAVWTGTGGDGVGNGSNCSGWVSTASLGLYGQSDVTNIAWTNLNAQNCNIASRLYCFAMP